MLKPSKADRIVRYRLRCDRGRSRLTVDEVGEGVAGEGVAGAGVARAGVVGVDRVLGPGGGV